MNRHALVLAAVLPLLAFAPVQAQKLEPGKWTGKITPPNEPVATEVTYDVTLKGDTIGIVINAGEHGSFTMSEVKLVEKTLTFWFQPGPRVDCSLTAREDGVYQGACRDENNGIATMVMIPPQKKE